MFCFWVIPISSQEKRETRVPPGSNTLLAESFTALWDHFSFHWHCCSWMNAPGEPWGFDLPTTGRWEPTSKPLRWHPSTLLGTEVHIRPLLRLQHVLFILCVNAHWTLLLSCGRCNFRDYRKTVCPDLTLHPIGCKERKKKSLFHLAVGISRTSSLTHLLKPRNFW